MERADGVSAGNGHDPAGLCAGGCTVLMPAGRVWAVLGDRAMIELVLEGLRVRARGFTGDAVSTVETATGPDGP